MIKSLISPLAWVLVVIICDALVGLRRSGRRSLRVAVLTAALALWVFSTPFLSSQLAVAIAMPAASDSVSVRPTKVVVLAGGSFVGSDLRFYLVEPTILRVIRGAEAFRNSHAQSIIMTGRAFSAEPGSEVASMRQLAIQLGVPPEKILLEPRAKTTFEHPTRILEERLAAVQERIILVSDPVHLRRAYREFHRYFPFVTPVSTHALIDVSPRSTQTWIPEADALALSTRVTREWIGIGWYAYRHWRER
ncbi:MAG TPA: YdcF family protein [Thermoanaerobaculia bacterium]|nr:YdcF family protein [Thermoanaerobaculia bacterium]